MICLVAPATQTSHFGEAYSRLSALECLVTQEDRVHGNTRKIRVLFRKDGKLLIAPLGAQDTYKQFKGSVLAESLLAAFLQQERPMLTAINRIGEEQLQGVPTESYKAYLSGSEVRLWVGKQDGLLRRVAILGPGDIPTLIESFTAVRVNPELADSLFIPHAPHRGVPSRVNPPPTAPQPAEVFDLGKLSPVDSPTVVHDFIFVNRTPAPLKLIRAQGSCGCLSTLIGAQEGREVLVAPGKSTPIRVSVALPGLAVGGLEKTVTVFAEGQTAPVARYELRGQVLPSILFEPSVLSFSPNTPREQIFQVVVDERLLKTERLPAIEGPQGFLGITPISPLGGTVQLRDGVRVRTFSFKARLLPTAPLGSQVGRLTFQATASLQSSFWKAASATVMAQVAGAVSAAPLALAFGAVTTAGDSLQTVTLTYQPGAGVGRVIQVDSPFLKVEATPTGGSASTEIIRLRLLGTCPNGVFQSKVQVRLKNGQTLSIPITAYIQRLGSGEKK